VPIWPEVLVGACDFATQEYIQIAADFISHSFLRVRISNDQRQPLNLFADIGSIKRDLTRKSWLK
jgi:hypothetical protein